MECRTADEGLDGEFARAGFLAGGEMLRDLVGVLSNCLLDDERDEDGDIVDGDESEDNC